MTRVRVLPTRADVDAAAARIAPFVSRTPCVPSPWLSDLTGKDVRLKLETLQPTGSFKIRGATNALMRLRETRRAVTRVVTASAGNHGQAIAMAASRLGLRVRVFVPESAPETKLRSMRRLGAEIVTTGSYDAAENAARAAAGEHDDVYVAPYNDADVIAGAGTVALEIAEDVPAVDLIAVPVGGGGLLSGVGLVLRTSPRAITAIAAEAKASPVFETAIRAREIVTVDVQPTLADGLAGNLEPGSITFELARAMPCLWTTVTEAQIASAMADLIRYEQLIVEGATAVAVAGVRALLDQATPFKTIVIVLSGRNVDAAVISRVLSA